MTRLRLALFDVDGTLVDSQAHIKAAMATAFEAIGRIPPDPELVLSIVGLSLPDAVARLAPDLDDGARDAVVARYKDAYGDLATGPGAHLSPLFPGAEACLDRLGQEPHVLLGVATGKSRRGLRHVLEMHALEGRFVTRQVADDHPSKPHPSMIEAALRETGVAARDAVMIGDTVFDMEMAAAAGVRALAVAWGYHGADALLAAGAADLATSFEEVPERLQAIWETSP